jgi:hypothetical protein
VELLSNFYNAICYWTAQVEAKSKMKMALTTGQRFAIFVIATVTVIAQSAENKTKVVTQLKTQTQNENLPAGGRENNLSGINSYICEFFSVFSTCKNNDWQ